MRRFAAVVLALGLALVTSCKKDSPSGLPPATDWNASQPPGGQAATPASPNAGANPHGNANPHGPGVGNPHAGVDMGGGGAHGGNPPAGNPHAGVDMSGGGGVVVGPVPQKTTARTLEKQPDGRLVLGPYTLAAPAGWTEKPITSSMRAAHFMLPGAAAGAEAELIVFYFGESGAGSVEDNLDRWLGQFQQASGKPSKEVAKIEKTKLGGQEATIVTVSGRYVTTSMPGGGDAIDKTDQALIGAIVGSPKGPYYFKLVGPKKTIDAQAPKVRAMLTSLKLR